MVYVPLYKQSIKTRTEDMSIEDIDDKDNNKDSIVWSTFYQEINIVES